MNLTRKFLLALAAVSNFVLPADACSLISFDDDGRYVGGDLATQIAAKANTIQIMRVSAQHLFRRTYSEGEWYLLYGKKDVPASWPEFTDEFAFEFSVVETLKGVAPPNLAYYEISPRIRGYAAAEQIHPLPNRLPDWVFDRPGHDRMEFTGGASSDSSLSLGECNPPYFLHVGETLLAFRDSMGRFYPMSGAFPLAIDTEFHESHRKTKGTFNMQSLVPIDGENDVFLLRLRRALSHRKTAS